MNADRDRTWIAAVEVAIALALLAAMLLPWWQITPSSADGTPIGTAYSVGIRGAGALSGSDVAVFLGPPIVLALVLLAAWRSRRSLLVLALVGFFVTETVGAFGLIEASSFRSFAAYPTHPDLGLQLFAWLCLAGTIVTAIDLTLGGTRTRLPRLRRAAA